jgi:putative ABC transport system ATP-binding protein
MPLIQLNNVSRIFYAEDVETHAVSNLSLIIEKGEYISIHGPSGCGKSTLLCLLGLLDAPSSGSYKLNEKNVEDLKSSERARFRNQEIGFVFQAFNLLSNLTVLENVELPLKFRAGINKLERKDRARKALEKVDMMHRFKHYPHQLSGGQQQRVAVARAIVGNPAIILADEPTGNLDSENSKQVMLLLSKLHEQGATICMVTHDPRYANAASRRIHMFDGRIVTATTTT